jgi:hypothetical protein
MNEERDYWAGWKDGWAAASEAIFSAQHQRGRVGLEPSLPETAGNKPSDPPRRRGRPPKAATMAAAAPAPRRRGRPPKNRTA